MLSAEQLESREKNLQITWKKFLEWKNKIKKMSKKVPECHPKKMKSRKKSKKLEKKIFNAWKKFRAVDRTARKSKKNSRFQGKNSWSGRTKSKMSRKVPECHKKIEQQTKKI